MSLDTLPTELLTRITTACKATGALSLQRTSESLREAVRATALEAQQPELLRLAQRRLDAVRAWLRESAARQIAPQIFGAVDEPDLWTAHLRRCAGAELQRRLAGDSPYNYLGEQRSSDEDAYDAAYEAWPPTLPLGALAMHGSACVAFKAAGKDGGDPEAEGYLFSGQATLCYGLEFSFSELRRLLYIGRRWYKGPSGMGGGASDPVEAEPDPARGPYFDFTDEEALQHALETSLDYSGPWLKYHLHDALADLLARIGMPTSKHTDPSDYVAWQKAHNSGVFSDVSLHCTGFQDSAGDDVVLGIRLGPRMCALGFDLDSQLGMSFLAGTGFVDEPSFAIQRVSADFTADLLGWPVGSLQHGALENELRSRMSKVLSALKWPGEQAAGTEMVTFCDFHVVFDAGC